MSVKRFLQKQCSVKNFNALGYGVLTLPIYLAFLPIKCELQRNGVTLRLFKPWAHISRRHFPHLGVSFQNNVDDGLGNFRLIVRIAEREIAVPLLSSNLEEGDHGAVGLSANSGDAVSVSWQALPTIEVDRREVCKGANNTFITVDSSEFRDLKLSMAKESHLDSKRSAVLHRILTQLEANGKSLADPVWIIGNAPGVNGKDLNSIPRHHSVFTMNRFHLSYNSHSLREDFVVCADDRVMKQFGEEITDKSVGTKIFVGKRDVSDGSSVIWIPLASSSIDSFSQSLSGSISPYGSTLVATLQIALAMGFSRIYLYGVELSFSGVENQRLSGRGLVGGDFHFIRDYRSGLPWNPPHWDRILEGLLAAAVVSEARGVEIRNFSTNRSFSMFPFDSL